MKAFREWLNHESRHGAVIVVLGLALGFFIIRVSS
jgi:hypothetical protein